MPPSSPCVNLCLIDDLSGLCAGCGRTLDEIARWGSLREEERLAVMTALPGRLCPQGDATLTFDRLDAWGMDS